MPTVPTPVGPRLETAPLPNTYRQAVDVSAPLRAMGAALSDASDAAGRIAADKAQTEAWQAQAKINQSFMAFDSEARKANQGVNAAGYSAKVAEWWDKAAKDYGGELTPLAQRLVTRNLAVAKNQALESALGYERVEGKRAKVEALDGALSAEVSRGSQSPTAAVASAAIVADMLRQHGASEGVPTEFVDKQIRQYQTALHANVINSLQTRDPAAAQAYFTAHKDEIDGARHDEITRSLNVAQAGIEGDQGAGKIWRDASVTPAKPPEVDKMEDQAREMFSGDKARQDAALAGLRQRAQAWEHAERQRLAVSTGAVWRAIDAGVPPGRVAAMPEFQALPGHEQHQIRLQVEQQAAVRESRALTAEQRKLTGMRTSEELLFRDNIDRYIEIQKPEVLAKMSAEEVGAQRTYFGLEKTQFLLHKREQVLSAEGRANANIDAQQFNAFAVKLGLEPNKKDKSPEEKARLASTQARAEMRVEDFKKKNNGKASRAEIDALLENEIKRTVEVSRWLLPNPQVPVISLTPEQLDKTLMTEEEVTKTREFMRDRLAKAKTIEERTRYTETPSNVRQVWLENAELSKRLRGARGVDVDNPAAAERVRRLMGP